PVTRTTQRAPHSTAPLHPRPSLPLSFYCSGAHRDLHSFPTRRSSDLSRMTVWTAIDSGTVYHFLEPTLIDGSTMSPNISRGTGRDRKSTRLNSSHVAISYAVFCLKKKKKTNHQGRSKSITKNTSATRT